MGKKKIYLQYSALGLQMAFSILLFIGIGYYLDNKFEILPVWTLVGSFVGFFSSIYFLIKEINIIDKLGKDDEKKEDDKKSDKK